MIILPIIRIGVDESFFCAAAGSGSRFVVVVDDIVASSFSGIDAVSTPVVEQVVPEIHLLQLRPAGVAAAAKAGVAAVVVCNQVMMKRGILTSPYTTITMLAFCVDRVAQALRDEAPLHGEVPVVVKRRVLICPPAHAAMVDDDIFVAYP